MEVNGAGPVQNTPPIQSTRPATQPQQSAGANKPASPVDEVQISSVGRMLDEANQSSELRAERLAQIKESIERGDYETPEKLEAALERLFGEIESDPDS